MQNSAEPVYIIDKVICYEPSKGYLVKWCGFGDKSNSWQKPRDMPVALHPDMKALKEVYDASAKLVRSRERSGSMPSPRSVVEVPIISKPPAELQKREAEAEFGIIENVLKYVPNKGYLVSWVGCNEASNSWQKPKDMPPACSVDMAKARNKYLQSKKSRVTACGPRRDKVQQSIKAPRRDLSKQNQGSSTCLGQCNTISTPKKEIEKQRKPRHIRKSFKKLVDRDRRVIHSVLEFDPTRGFLVHWKNQPSSQDTWIQEDRIGAAFREQMMLASERYCDNLI